MRIGAFAEKYNVKKSTIRYYVQKQLLYPIKEGTYPDFDEICEKDMALILEFRQLGFTIEEIKDVLVKRRIFSNRKKRLTEEETKQLEEKKIMLLEAKHTIEKQLENLEEKLMNPSIHDHNTYGIHIELIMKLTCKTCHKNYVLKNATIEESRVIQGELSCPCNKTYSITNGVIHHKNEIKRHELKRDIPINNFLMSQVKNGYYFALRDLGSEALKVLTTWQHNKGVLIHSSLEEFFVMNLERCFQEDGIYYFVVPVLEELIRVQNQLIHTKYYDRCVFILMTDCIIDITYDYFFDISSYSSDLICEIPWTIEKLNYLDQAKNGLYLDLGYYKPDQKYFNMILKHGFVYKQIYRKKYKASELLDDHPDSKIIETQLFEFNER